MKTSPMEGCENMEIASWINSNYEKKRQEMEIKKAYAEDYGFPLEIITAANVAKAVGYGVLFYALAILFVLAGE